MSFTKADGAKIKITFDQPITAGAASEQSHFTVTVPEYDYVPGGVLQNVTKTVKSTYALAGVQQTLDLSAGTLIDTSVSADVLYLRETSGTSGDTYYYNSEQLPQIPTVSEYPYVAIRKDTTSNRFDAIYSQTPYYYSPTAIWTNDGVYAIRYALPLDKSGSWAYFDQSHSGFTSSDTRKVFWANSDITDGKGSSEIWLAGSAPVGNITYGASGHAIFAVTGITAAVAESSISWAESKPTGTTLTVSVSTDGTNYSAVTNGGQFLPPGSYDNATAYIKIELATTDATATPTVSDLHFVLRTSEDKYAMVLEMEPQQRFESAAGNITVAYDGAGTLQGAGGPVAAFSRTFAPTELVAKPHQNDAEHISIASVAAAGTLTRIYYRDGAAFEHISIAGITAVGKLTNVKDI